MLVLALIAITLYALFDAIGSPKQDVRLLPKWLWIFLIVILWIGGAVLWFFLGRPSRSGQHGGSGGGRGGGAPPVGPDDDPDFLTQLDWDRKKPKHDNEQ